jgi:hypothetical protein
MKQNCGNCGYFESKGLMSGSTNWGLCSKFTKGITDNNKESPFFRWEDDTCSDFESSQEYSGLQRQRSKPR